MGAPVYNTEWETKEPIWSVAFNSNNMQVGVGQFTYFNKIIIIF